MSTPISPFVIRTPEDVPMAFPEDTTWDEIKASLKVHSEMDKGTFSAYREESHPKQWLLATARDGVVTLH